MKATTKTQKTVTVLFTYIFKHICRVCFVVLSSDEETRYHTCFDNGKASCTCPAGQKHHICYHVTQLRPRYNAIVASKQQVSTPAATTDETHRVSCVHGLRTRWYPEYRQGDEWYRFPEPDGNQAVFFVIEGRAEAWLAERLAAVAEQAAEAKMDAFRAAMDEQYASDPRKGLSQGEMEAARSNMVHLYDEY